MDIDLGPMRTLDAASPEVEWQAAIAASGLDRLAADGLPEGIAAMVRAAHPTQRWLRASVPVLLTLGMVMLGGALFFGFLAWGVPLLKEDAWTEGYRVEGIAPPGTAVAVFFAVFGLPLVLYALLQVGVARVQPPDGLALQWVALRDAALAEGDVVLTQGGQVVRHLPTAWTLERLADEAAAAAEWLERTDGRAAPALRELEQAARDALDGLLRAAVAPSSGALPVGLDPVRQRYDAARAAVYAHDVAGRAWAKLPPRP